MKRAAPEGYLGAIPPRHASDEAIEAAAAEAGLMPLIMSAIHITGRLDILDQIPPTKPAQFSGDDTGSIPAEDALRLRRLAAQAIKRWRDDGCPAPYHPSPEDVRRMTDVLVGFPMAPRYAPLVAEELALDGDARGFAWTRPVSAEAKQRHSVLVVGAGLSGLVMGHRLKQAGIPFTIVEKNSGPGGTWFENRYPGARVDVPSYCYSFSFTPEQRWPELFSASPVLRDYFAACLEHLDLAPHTRFGVEAARAVYDAESKTWEVTLKSSEGEETTRVSAFVSAVGQLNRALIPAIEGDADYQGLRFHTSRWPAGLDLAGKRVAVIGTAATALQLIPEVALEAARLTVFQRSPTWCAINAAYRRAMKPAEQWAVDHLPGYARWYRIVLYNWSVDINPDHMLIDPDWPKGAGSISAANERMRRRMSEMITEAVGGDPVLAGKVVPTYPPGVKRPNLGDGGFYRALTRDNVELVTDGIERFTETGILDKAGVSRDFDVVVYATGFRALEYLAPMEIVGPGGQRLNDFWQDEPGAYLGVTVPGFPNLFMMFGPGTNLGYNGNLFFNSECQARYISLCLRWMIEDDLAAIEVRHDVYAAFEARKDKALARFTWSLPSAGSWYKNKAGKVVANSPWPLVDYWEWTRAPDPADFEVVKADG